MNRYYIHDAEGIFTGAVLSCPGEFVSSNIPEGLYAYFGDVNTSSSRLDMSTDPPTLVPYIRQADETADIRAADADARAERVRRFAAVDARIARHAREVRIGISPTTDDIAALDAYAHALADLPATAGWPLNITWPEEP